MSLEKDSHQPLYRQLMKELKSLIRTGQYKPGDKIPTEPELSEQYEVSRITVRKTIEELCKQGYLVKQQGKGTFVEAPKIYRKIEQQSNESFTETCRMNERKPYSHVLSSDIVEPEKWQQDFLHLPDGEHLIAITRVLSADRIPVIYEQIYLPAKRFTGFPVDRLENGSLFQLLEESYHFKGSARSRSTIEIGTASQKIAEHLNILAGEPVMILCNYIEDQQNQPVYISYETIVGSRYMISI
ncbi:GntR family transcriptional regulator [Clostridium sp. Marseille-P2415]|uniref:GntR family transcriptional regulator n=1 Tax=Clostridium sp. Marseille-P2415 TaxID=1805471 RepID=UPI000988501D|nr:GntR family transcriptional regulator [Clostridium sp. Marseille-P2415]